MTKPYASLHKRQLILTIKFFYHPLLFAPAITCGLLLAKFSLGGKDIRVMVVPGGLPLIIRFSYFMVK